MAREIFFFLTCYHVMCLLDCNIFFPWIIIHRFLYCFLSFSLMLFWWFLLSFALSKEEETKLVETAYKQSCASASDCWPLTSRQAHPGPGDWNLFKEFNPIYHEQADHQLKISYCCTWPLWTARISPKRKLYEKIAVSPRIWTWDQ